MLTLRVTPPAHPEDVVCGVLVCGLLVGWFVVCWLVGCGLLVGWLLVVLGARALARAHMRPRVRARARARARTGRDHTAQAM